MPFQYKKVLVIGATSGIGEALAEKLVAAGSSVIVTGRRKENLDKFVEHHGNDKAQAVVLDITKLDAIQEVVRNIINTHDDIDCVVLNAGVQRRSDWTEPESINMDDVMLEFTTNYFAYLALTKELIPFLRAKSQQTALVYVSSNLGLVPMAPRSNYCATKAALHQWLLCLRVALQKTNVKVIEVYPPAVQTELHDERHQPDIKDGRQMGMPLADFIQEAWDGLCQGKVDIPVGVAHRSYDAFETKRREFMAQMFS